MKTKILSIIMLLCLTSYAFTIEVLTEFSEDTVSILNDELKKLTDADLWERDSGNSEVELIEASDIDAQSKNIKNVLDPTADQHAATKKYHDDNIAVPPSDVALGTDSGPTTTSATYVDMPQMSVTMTTGANKVLILFNSSISQLSGNTAKFILDIDGTDEATTERIVDSLGANVRFPVSFIHLETMTSGSHTFKVQWQTNGTVTARDTARELIVIELK